MAGTCLYVVRFWADPKQCGPLMDWLDRGHMADVASQPGFLGVRRVRLEETAADGWQAYLMLYELESRAALQAYFARADLQAKFAEERRPFQDALRIERSWGEVEASVGSGPDRA